MNEREPSPQPGSIVELDVLDQPYGPDAIARYNGMAVFVADAVPGDHVRARITEVFSRYTRAQTEEVLAPSEHRVAAPCPVADTCGGCQWQTMTYARQCSAKETAVRDALIRIGKWSDPAVRPIIPSLQEWRYRNKARYSVESDGPLVEAGYYTRQSRTLVPIRACPLNLDGLDAALGTTVGLLSEEAHLRDVAPSLHALVGRQSLATGEIVIRFIQSVPADLRLIAEAVVKTCPGVVGVVRNMAGKHRRRHRDRVLVGQGYLTEVVECAEYRVSAAAFFQVNPYATPALVRTVVEAAALSGNEVVVDAYGGVGLFAFALAEQAAQVALVEIEPTAVASAREMIAQRVSDVVSLHEGSVEQMCTQIASADVIVCDPPRDGAGRDALAALDMLGARRFVYVACDPTSLARDSACLRKSGYSLRWAQPLDLFPHTFHVETVALFER